MQLQALDLMLVNLINNMLHDNGGATNDQSGVSVSAAGDVDNDGYDDIIVGANGADPSSRGDAGQF